MLKKCFSVLMVVAATQAFAGFTDVAQGYNVMTFGDFSDTNDQIHGKIAAAGNATIKNSFGVNVDHRGSTSTAIVSGGNVYVGGNGEVHGSIYAAGNASVNCANVIGNVTAKNITMEYYGVSGTMYYTQSVSAPYGNKQQIDVLPTSPVDFLSTKNAALTLSSEYSSQGTKNYRILDNVLYFYDNSATSTVNYYTLDASDLAGISSLHFDNLSEYNIINVNGNGQNLNLNSIDRQNYNEGTDYNFASTLFNFYNMSNLTIGSLYGNILAADVDVTAKDGETNGTMVAKSFFGKYEFHETGDFNPPPPSPPEPPHDVPENSTTAMIIAGLFLIAIVSAKRFSVSKN